MKLQSIFTALLKLTQFLSDEVSLRLREFHTFCVGFNIIYKLFAQISVLILKFSWSDHALTSLFWVISFSVYLNVYPVFSQKQNESVRNVFRSMAFTAIGNTKNLNAFHIQPWTEVTWDTTLVTVDRKCMYKHVTKILEF